MRDPYFQCLLSHRLTTPLPFCANVALILQLGMESLCFALAFALPYRVAGKRVSGTVATWDKLGDFEDPVSSRPRGGLPWSCAGSAMEEYSCRDGYSDSIHGAGQRHRGFSALSYRKTWMDSIGPTSICLDQPQTQTAEHSKVSVLNAPSELCTET